MVTFFIQECLKCGTGRGILFSRLYKEENQILFIRLAAIAQLGERQTEDLKVPGSIPGGGIFLQYIFYIGKKFFPKKI